MGGLRGGKVIRDCEVWGFGKWKRRWWKSQKASPVDRYVLSISIV